jgi:hypothetical protein
MASQPRRPQPNKDDPLSEPTVGRRLWAAYLRAGYSRRTFADELDVPYGRVDGWDTDKHQPHLEVFGRACRLVGFTPGQILYGRDDEVAAPRAPGLEPQDVKKLLDSIGASPDQRRALAEYVDSAAGRYQNLTATFVIAFVEAYAKQIAIRKTHDKAIESAAAVATDAAAKVEARSVNARPYRPEKPTRSRR